MKAEVIADYDRTRNFTDKAVRSVCYAPHTNLYFDQQGRAKACCWNWEAPLGNVKTHTIDQIWHSVAGAHAPRGTRALRFDQGLSIL